MALRGKSNYDWCWSKSAFEKGWTRQSLVIEGAKRLHLAPKQALWLYKAERIAPMRQSDSRTVTPALSPQGLYFFTLLTVAVKDFDLL